MVRIEKKNSTFQLPLSMIAFAVVYVSIVFEFVMPKFSARYTADPMDIVFYALGALFFFLFQAREKKLFGKNG